jgi:hypothetical protein
MKAALSLVILAFGCGGFQPDSGLPAPPGIPAFRIWLQGRPHIAYYSGADLKVYYATRFDR